MMIKLKYIKQSFFDREMFGLYQIFHLSLHYNLKMKKYGTDYDKQEDC